MSRWLKKNERPPTRTLYRADLATHHNMLGLGWGQIPGKPTVGKWSLQISIQEHPTAPFIGPVPCTSLCFSNLYVSLWLLSAPNLLRYGNLPYHPYLTFYSTFILCLISPNAEGIWRSLPWKNSRLAYLGASPCCSTTVSYLFSWLI